MMTCHVCGVTKANSQLYRLGETERPICKSCKGLEQPHAEFEAMRVATVVLERLMPDERRRVLKYVSERFTEASV